MVENIVSQGSTDFDILVPEGQCPRCRRNWSTVKIHKTRYDETYSCLALCEACWFDLSNEERLPYYKSLHNNWRSFHGGETYDGEPWPIIWQKIEKAVLAGL